MTTTICNPNYKKLFLFILSFPQVKMSALTRKQTFMIKILIWGREYEKKINCPKIPLLLLTKVKTAGH